MVVTNSFSGHSVSGTHLVQSFVSKPSILVLNSPAVKRDVGAKFAKQSEVSEKLLNDLIKSKFFRYDW